MRLGPWEEESLVTATRGCHLLATAHRQVFEGWGCTLHETFGAVIA